MRKNWIIGFGKGVHEYRVNGVTYIASSYFKSRYEIKSMTLSDRMKRIISGDFVHLTNEFPSSTMTEECVCSTAGEED